VSTIETGQVTGTKDKDYNLVWFTEQRLSNVLRMRPTSKTPSVTARQVGTSRTRIHCAPGTGIQIKGTRHDVSPARRWWEGAAVWPGGSRSGRCGGVGVSSGRVAGIGTSVKRPFMS
jgi:hypothetical protein